MHSAPPVDRPDASPPWGRARVPTTMASTLLARLARALPYYLFGVLMVLALGQILAETTVVRATEEPEPAEAPAEPAATAPSLQLTILVGTCPLPVLLPTRID